MEKVCRVQKNMLGGISTLSIKIWKFTFWGKYKWLCHFFSIPFLIRRGIIFRVNTLKLSFRWRKREKILFYDHAMCCVWVCLSLEIILALLRGVFVRDDYKSSFIFRTNKNFQTCYCNSKLGYKNKFDHHHTRLTIGHEIVFTCMEKLFSSLPSTWTDFIAI